MKFITEIDLRNEYRQRPFETYQLGKLDRLTSEAKQFLQDRQVEIIREDHSAASKVINKMNEEKQCLDKSFYLKAQLLYTSTLQVILLAKNYHSDICEELYSISLVIKQLASDKNQEFSLQMPNDNQLLKQDNITLDKLFSQEGELLVMLFNLDTKLNLFMLEHEDCFTEEQQKQLDIISLRVKHLTAHLIGE